MPTFDPDAGEDTKRLVRSSVAEWPGVREVERYGCPAYTAYGELFLILETDAVILLNLPPSDIEEIQAEYDPEPVRVEGSSKEGWTRVPIPANRIDDVLEYITSSYAMTKNIA